MFFLSWGWVGSVTHMRPGLGGSCKLWGLAQHTMGLVTAGAPVPLFSTAASSSSDQLTGFTPDSSAAEITSLQFLPQKGTLEMFMLQAVASLPLPAAPGLEEPAHPGGHPWQYTNAKSAGTRLLLHSWLLLWHELWLHKSFCISTETTQFHLSTDGLA